ncbi:HAD family hydrolase [Arcanobacterium ihumii]|uniref:HAD family hydrolase n=1 Tax=Arcanobacterium ihumii TaxID=2138162 RepID=UPI000F5407F8|nr:HAD-IA family hydrolase [Arcanobacterium ihumii]
MKTLLFDLYGLFMKTQSDAGKHAIEQAARLGELGVDPSEFWQVYREVRDPLDAGRINFAEYVDLMGDELGVEFSNWEDIFKADCESWIEHDDVMVAWLEELKASVEEGSLKARVALLSNIPAALLAKIREEKPWLKRFEPAFFSCGLGIAKPQEKIFTYVVKVLETTPKEILFFDDTRLNVDVAQKLGINAHHFQGIEGAKQAVSEFLGGRSTDVSVAS